MINSIACPDSVASLFGIFDPSIAPPLLYYAYIPIMVLSLIFGSYILIGSKFSVVSKIIFILSIFFAIFLLNEISTWIAVPSPIVHFGWQIVPLLRILIILLLTIFVLAYSYKKLKLSYVFILTFLILLPILILLPSEYNLIFFDLINCEGVPGQLWTYANFIPIFLGILILLSLLYLIYYNKRKNEKIEKQVIFIHLAAFAFIVIFSISNFYGDLTTVYEIALISPLGMVAFLALLTYAIVKFKAFNVKLIAAQALVVGIIILVGSQFFFIRSKTNMILNGVTFVLSCGFGWWLIRSVKSENARKEQLQFLADQLAGSNAKLQKMDNTKTEFISVASHQLRTPPTAIKGYSSLLLEGSYGKLQPDQIYALNNIYRRNEDMILLIDNLLNTSRIEAGTMVFDFGKFKMEDLLQDIHETLIIKAKTNKLTLEVVRPAKALPEITSDKAKLKETLSNLVENAIKYTKKGGVKVETSLQKGFTVLSHESSNPTPVAGAENRDPETDVVRVVVTDTGIGIPEKELPFLFQKFSRGKDISRLNVSGTGLGLFVGKKIMEQLGGQVWAESKGLNKGSRFIMEIPVEGKEMPQN